jgi:hypothetical protein
VESGAEIGKWRLLDKIGHGGNADVWRAEAGGQEVALKVLRSRKRDSEQWQRFRREVAAHAALEDVEGVLPLLEAELPEDPREKGWLAMPLATPLDDWLVGETLEVVVETLVDVADALARLAERGIAHRDVKPANLFRYGGRSVVGDLGLLDLPDADPITGPAGIRGPAHFVAYEIYRGDPDADARSGDVFSLAKTLWVLATGQNFPPPGHQRGDETAEGIAAYTPHRFARELDQVIDRATRLDPATRPPMSEFAADLRAWLRLLEAGPSHAPDLAQAAARLRLAIAPELEAEEQERARVLAYGDAASYMKNKMEPVIAAVQDALPGAYASESPEEIFELFSYPRGMGLPQVIGSYGYGVVVRVRPPLPIGLVSGMYVEALDDGSMNLGAAHIVGRRTIGGQEVTWQDQVSVSIGTLQQNVEIDRLEADLSASLAAAVDRFVELVEAES